MNKDFETDNYEGPIKIENAGSLDILFNSKEEGIKCFKLLEIHLKLIALYKKNKQLCNTYFECENFKQFIYELDISKDYDFFKRILQVDFDKEDLKFYFENDY